MQLYCLEKNEADETSKQAQVLWSSCQALLRAIRAGCPGIPWKDQIRPLEPELTAVEKAAGIKVVIVVLSNLYLSHTYQVTILTNDL